MASARRRPRAHVGPPRAAEMAGPTRPLTLAAATTRCAHWQHVLRLEDWDVRLEIARIGDLGAGTLGECDAHRIKRQARIKLLDPRDVEGQQFWFDGQAWRWEITLVHELLHLHFHDVFPQGWPGDDKPEAVAAERAIHALSIALVTGARTGKPQGTTP